MRLSASENREPLYRIDGYALYRSDEEAAMAHRPRLATAPHGLLDRLQIFFVNAPCHLASLCCG